MLTEIKSIIKKNIRFFFNLIAKATFSFSLTLCTNNNKT